MRISTNMPGLTALSSRGRELRPLPKPSISLIRACLASDLVIVEHTGTSLFLACLAGRFSRFHLVSVDPIVSRPLTLVDRMKMTVKRWLLRRVDCYIQYFRDVRGFAEIVGADPARFAYVPFKANSLGMNGVTPVVHEGDFVLCAGRSRRDVTTFVEALRLSGLPGIIVQQAAGIMAAHGTTALGQEGMPANVRIVIDEAGEMAHCLAAARLVVLPRYRDDANATGISTYLAAMSLGKCVILSRGPGADDVLDNQAAFVEPEDPRQLADAIVRLYHDDVERHRIAAAGKRYADQLGGDERLLADVLHASIASQRSVVMPAGTGRQADPDRAQP